MSTWITTVIDTTLGAVEVRITSDPDTHLITSRLCLTCNSGTCKHVRCITHPTIY